MDILRELNEALYALNRANPAQAYDFTQPALSGAVAAIRDDLYQLIEGYENGLYPTHPDNLDERYMTGAVCIPPNGYWSAGFALTDQYRRISPNQELLGILRNGLSGAGSTYIG